MKTQLAFFILAFTFCPLFAQQHSIVGKWKLINHYYYLSDSNQVYQKDTSIYHNQQPVFSVFQKNGVYQRIIGNDTLKGKWKINKSNKLKIRRNDKSSLSSKPFYTRGNTFQLSEFLTFLYDSTQFTFDDGSHYYLVNYPSFQQSVYIKYPNYPINAKESLLAYLDSLCWYEYKTNNQSAYVHIANYMYTLDANYSVLPYLILGSPFRSPKELELWKKGLSIASPKEKVWFYLKRARLRLGDIDGDAITDLQKAKSLDSTNSFIYSMLFEKELFAEIKPLEQVISDNISLLHKALHYFPQNPTALHYLLQYHINEGHEEKALAMIKKLKETNYFSTHFLFLHYPEGKKNHLSKALKSELKSIYRGKY